MNVATYLRSVHPGTLVIPAGTLQHEAKRLKEEYAQQIIDFCKAVNVEMATVKQIVHAIYPQYDPVDRCFRSLIFLNNSCNFPVNKI